MHVRHLFCALWILLGSGSLFAFIDEFDTDPLANPEWTLYQPVGGVTFTQHDSVLRVTLPASTQLLDHWAGVDNGTQLRLTELIPFENFTVETRMRFLGAGDPDNPTWPPMGEAYHIVLMVYFGQFDTYYWGPYAGPSLHLERSGINGICITDPGLQEFSLQVKKTGTLYTWSYRANDTDAWTFVCGVDDTTGAIPQYAGFMFKTWGTLTQQETVELDYFKMEEVLPTAPTLEMACPFGNPDIAWIDMPYVRPFRVDGFPFPDVTVTAGPPELLYDPTRFIVYDWTPETVETVAMELEAVNDGGTETLGWNVQVAEPLTGHDDEFDADPTLDTGYWSLYEPQGGIGYSIVEFEGSNWWRLDVPFLGDQGLSFDHWSTVDLAPQLRHPLAGEEEFVFETRLRIDQESPPLATDLFHAGLLIYFSRYDAMYFGISNERALGAGTQNIVLERSGAWNLAYGYVDGIVAGTPVHLRAEKKCDQYAFFFRTDADPTWILAGTYSSPSAPESVGLVVKTWGGGASLRPMFDYFNMIGPKASFTATPEEGPEPLTVAVDASGSQSPTGAITTYEWNFGDGATGSGVTQSHVYPTRGRYVITLTVTDAMGKKSTRQKAVVAKFASGDVSPWTSVDVGEPMVEGGARLEQAGCMTVYAGGNDISFTADEFHFVYQTLQGDCSVTARLSSANWPTQAKIGVMLREDLTPSSRFASILFYNLVPAPKYGFIYREPSGGSAKLPKYSTDAFTIPDAWVRIERSGGEVTCMYSANGSDWTPLGPATPVAFGFPDTVLGGICATARDLQGNYVSLDALLCDITVEGGGGPGGPVFHRGDADQNEALELTDAIQVLGYLFLGSTTKVPECEDAADADDNGTIELTDAIRILGYLFLGTGIIPPPGATEEPCGEDPTTEDELGCTSYDAASCEP